MTKTILLSLLVFCSCTTKKEPAATGSVIRLDAALNELVDVNTSLEVLDTGYKWTEGPIWVKDSGYLLFSDVKQNTIFKYKEGEGVTQFLKPSGYSGITTYSAEPGSNGLIVNQQGDLVACEHGDRRLSAMPLATKVKRTLADNYKGTRFNSPNDVVQKRNGDYYFTDPPYGLPGQVSKEKLGVYRLNTQGALTLLVDSLTPNGLAFSPDEQFLYVNQSLPAKAYIMRYTVKEDGTLRGGTLFFDATAMVAEGLPGLPDGLKLDQAGNLFATGPGGVLIISPAGKLLGRIDTTQPTANCNWGEDGTVLYITANDRLCRIKTKTKGAGW